MVYGAFAALAQKDFKRLVAYSSVSHMGYVMLGIGVWSAMAGTQLQPDYWQMGMNGAMFQMIAHGISSAGMFFMVGVVYDRVHHRNLDEFGGLFAKMPLYSGLGVRHLLRRPWAAGLVRIHRRSVRDAFASGTISHALAVISASVVILDGRLYPVDDCSGFTSARNTKARTATILRRSPAASWRSPRRCWPWPSCSASIRRRCSTI